MFWFFGHEAYGIFAPQPVTEAAVLALQGEVLTPGPPGESLIKALTEISLDGGIILNYPGRPDVITSIVISKRWRQEESCQRRRRDDRSRGQSDGRGKCRQLLEGQARNDFSPRARSRIAALPTSCFLAQ